MGWKYGLTMVLLLAASLAPLYFIVPSKSCYPGWLFVLGYLVALPGTVLVVHYMYSRMRRIVVELGGSEIIVRYGLGELRILGEAVSDVSFEPRVKLYLRLGGMSLPGLHIGLYSSSLGRIWAFLNRLDQVVRIDLHDGRRILVSPEAPLALVERIRNMVSRNLRVHPQVNGGVVTRSGDARVLAVSLALVLLVTAYSLGVVYPSMPDRVPVHFSTNMQPDRWGSKTTYLAIHIISVVFAVFMAIIVLIIGRTSPGLGYIPAPAMVGFSLMMLGAMEMALCFTG